MGRHPAPRTLLLIVVALTACAAEPSAADPDALADVAAQDTATPRDASPAPDTRPGDDAPDGVTHVDPYPCSANCGPQLRCEAGQVERALPSGPIPCGANPREACPPYVRLSTSFRGSIPGRACRVVARLPSGCVPGHVPGAVDDLVRAG